VAVGVAEGRTTTLFFESWALTHTIRPSRNIPTSTANITRPEGPCFRGGNDAGVKAGTGMFTAAGTEVTSTRETRDCEDTGTGGTTNLSIGLTPALASRLRADVFTGLFLATDFFASDFLVGIFLLTAFFAAVFLGAAFLDIDFLAAGLFATDFLGVAFLTATVTPWVAVRTGRKRTHIGEGYPSVPSIAATRGAIARTD
jgi:hypothetical protein